MKKYILLSLFLLSIIINSIIFANGDLNKISKIINFDNDLIGDASLTNDNKLFFLNLSNSNGHGQWVEWQKNGKTIKRIMNASGCKISPDGKYYSYLDLQDYKINIIDADDDEKINTFSTKRGANVQWTSDSKNLIIETSDNLTKIYKFNISTGVTEKILESEIFFSATTVINNNILYLLKDKTPDAPDSDCDIVRYNLLTKKFEVISFPFIKDLWIFDYFTVSPDEKIIVFQNCSLKDSAMYIISMDTLKVIDKIKLKGNVLLSGSSWSHDSSHFIFTATMKEIYKYTIPKY
ncbi:MAG: hypothetical protein GXY86_05225 [Firmicutes bacterium]|nr:hypothetical protein [Bacillota bacterium]